MPGPDVHPADLTIAQAGAALRGGTLTALALTQAHLARIDQRDPAIGAFVHLARDAALAAARAADRTMGDGTDLGPMHGIPFAIKDLFDVQGWPVRWGTGLQQHRLADRTAPAVQALLDGGGVPLGLVATYEMATVGPDATSLYRQPVNPWSAAHVTGGSSSGCAAAVAAGLVRAALGTDTGGSIRSPAAYCGVGGLKPTFGALPTADVMPLSPALDHVGPLGRTVGDTAAIFAVLSGQSPFALTGIAGLRLAYGRNWATGTDGHAALLPALDDAASMLSLCGAELRLVALPDYAAIESLGSDILLAEAWAIHGAPVEAQPDKVGAMARASILSGGLIDAARLQRARSGVAALRDAIDAVLADNDALILPTTMTPAPPFAAFAGGAPLWTAMRTLPFNLTGHPALSVPMGFADGLPLGLQIVGRHGDEATLLRIGAAFEAATDHGVLQPRGF